MGVYELHFMKNGRPKWKCTTCSLSKTQFLWWDPNGYWMIGENIGKEDKGWILSYSNQPFGDKIEWEYWNGGWVKLQNGNIAANCTLFGKKSDLLKILVKRNIP